MAFVGPDQALLQSDNAARHLKLSSQLLPRHQAKHSIDVRQEHDRIYPYSLGSPNSDQQLRPPQSLSLLSRNDKTARNVWPEISLHPPGVMDVRSFGSWMSAPHACFFARTQGPARSFCPGMSARMIPGRPQDIWPENFLFGLCFAD